MGMVAEPSEPAWQAVMVEPIGVARTSFTRKDAAPRQPTAAAPSAGRIELRHDRGFQDALSDLERWSHIWVLFWFDRAQGWKPKVLPPRSQERRGVFATRSPHRPNPIGMSAVELAGVEGLTVHVRGLDVLDGTPVLDLKPYVGYADAIDGASSGWLTSDPGPHFDVRFSAHAEQQLAFLAQHGVALRQELERRLALGPQPHAYRRIRPTSTGHELAWRDWRAHFSVEATTVLVQGCGTGYRPRQLADDSPAREVHRAFVKRFGWPGTDPKPGRGDDNPA